MKRLYVYLAVFLYLVVSNLVIEGLAALHRLIYQDGYIQSVLSILSALVVINFALTVGGLLLALYQLGLANRPHGMYPPDHTKHS